MFPLEIRINFVKIVINRWFSSVSSEDFKRIILILVLDDWLKNFRTKCENRTEKYWLVRILWAIKVVDRSRPGDRSRPCLPLETLTLNSGIQLWTNNTRNNQVCLFHNQKCHSYSSNTTTQAKEVNKLKFWNSAIIAFWSDHDDCAK